jgi:hypothetical protein
VYLAALYFRIGSDDELVHGRGTRKRRAPEAVRCVTLGRTMGASLSPPTRLHWLRMNDRIRLIFSLSVDDVTGASERREDDGVPVSSQDQASPERRL